MTIKRNTPELVYKTFVPLPRTGECGLLGIDRAGLLYAEVLYDREWIAQYALDTSGAILVAVDEDYGQNRAFLPLTLPDDIQRPNPAIQTTELNFTGPRLRGLRQTDRIDVMAHPIDMRLKMRLIERLGLNMMPPVLRGIGESQVLSEACLQKPDYFIVCRRLRLIYTLPARQLDADGEPYDYDTITLQLAHFYDSKKDEALLTESMLQSLPGAELAWPVEVIAAGNILAIADSGDEEGRCGIHVWHMA